jgi:hypothetical protein
MTTGQAAGVPEAAAQRLRDPATAVVALDQPIDGEAGEARAVAQDCMGS